MAWAWYNNKVRTLQILRDDDWLSTKLGIGAELGAQIDLEYHGFKMRISDPFLTIKAVSDDSYLKKFGLEVCGVPHNSNDPTPKQMDFRSVHVLVSFAC